MGTFWILLSAAGWATLACGRGGFWRSRPELPVGAAAEPCRVTALIPARNEAEGIAAAVGSLRRQRFSGLLRILVVDDNSTDGTGEIVREMAGEDGRVRLIEGSALPPGWTGKMWAVSQGLDQPEAQEADYVLLTDADIVHGEDHLEALVATAQQRQLGLTSEMVVLRTESWAERATMPAFVFFFAMLYPFAWVAEPQRHTAAAAGGVMLVSRAALERIGGVGQIRDALIDDCALARQIKGAGFGIWLGHAREAASLRRYPRLRDVWAMIARTAYVQLRCSPLLLAGTLSGMTVLYGLPPALSMRGRGATRVLAVGTWAAMALLLQPTLRRFRQPALWGAALPGIAGFYLLATAGSAVRWYTGRGGAWKGRVYARAEETSACGAGCA